jgi:hypothetical protein
VGDLARLAEPYFGKAPGDLDGSDGETDADAGDAPAPSEGNAESDPASKPRSGSRFIYSWSPWEESDSLSAERR